MAKRKRGTTPESIERRIKEGRGTGRMLDYRPWLHIQDVPSKGLTTRVKGWKTARVHHLLSKNELAYFYTLEWSLDVVDIREQFPLLPQKETIAIAEGCGVTHPTDPRTRCPIIMTTDFNVSVRTDGKTVDYVRTVKHREDLESKRTLEKLEIERRYFDARGIDWKIVTENDFSMVLAKNVEWIHPYRDICDFTPLSQTCVSQMANALSDRVVEQRALSDIALECDDKLGFDPGTGLSVARHLLATRRWQVDMTKKIIPREQLILIVPAQSAYLRIA